MRATALLLPERRIRRLKRIDVAWGLLALVCLGAMMVWPRWEAIPFHVIWITLILLYSFRVWPLPATGAVLVGVALATGGSILADAIDGRQLWGELFEVPLMSGLFLAVVWHARSRVQALDTARGLADERASLLEMQERLLQNVSHELRTPVTIARGHLELLQRQLGSDRPQLTVAFEELERIERILTRVLLLAGTERPSAIVRAPVELVALLEDVFMRWAEVAERGWRLGPVVEVTIDVDETWLRAALDALIENAVQYTAEQAPIELSAVVEDKEVVISVADGGHGIPAGALGTIFERFERADAARSRGDGGAGLGLAIVQAIAHAHGGSCSASSVEGEGSVFELRLPARELTSMNQVRSARTGPEAEIQLGHGGLQSS